MGEGDGTRGTRAVPELRGGVQCQQQALLEASWWGYGTTDTIHYRGVSPDIGAEGCPCVNLLLPKQDQTRGKESCGQQCSLSPRPPPAVRVGYPRALLKVPRLWVAPGFISGTLCRAVGPQVREGTREALAQGRDPQWVQPMAGGAGPRPAAPAVSLSDELHAIRRC